MAKRVESISPLAYEIAKEHLLTSSLILDPARASL